MKKSSTSTLVKVAGMAISMILSVFLGRTIGAEGLGVINLSNRIVNVLLVIGLLGMRQVIVKEVSIAQTKGDYKHIANLMYTVYWLNGGTTLLLSILFIFLSPWLATAIFNEPSLTYPLMIALIAITPQALTRIFSSSLVGYRKIWQSNLVEQTLSIAITATILLVLWFINFNIDINNVAISYVVGRIAVTLTVSIYWKRKYAIKNEKKFIAKRLLKTSTPLFIFSVAGIITASADTVLLGILADSKEVGLYTVAARIALLTGFFLQVTNASIAPKIASLFENGKITEMKLMVKKITTGLLILGFFQLILFLFTGKYILSIWGEEFIQSYYILIILSFSQFVSIGTGAVGLILTMCGHERTQKNISIFYLILNIIFNVVFISMLGAIGAAITTAITVMGSNVTKLVMVKKYI